MFFVRQVELANEPVCLWCLNENDKRENDKDLHGFGETAGMTSLELWSGDSEVHWSRGGCVQGCGEDVCQETLQVCLHSMARRDSGGRCREGGRDM